MIDLIIPMYNAENFIDRIVTNIITQNKDIFRATIVDDCSTDDSIKVLEEKLQNTEFNYQILKMPEHTGQPGIVRQYGIDNTNYPFLVFCDSDDILFPDALQIMLREISHSQLKVLCTPFYEEHPNGTLSLHENGKEGWFTWLHGNIYSREALERNQIKFNKFLVEDGILNFEILLADELLGFLDIPLYIWKHNEESIVRGCDNYFLMAVLEKTQGYLDCIKHFKNFNSITFFDFDNHSLMVHLTDIFLMSFEDYNRLMILKQFTKAEQLLKLIKELFYLCDLDKYLNYSQNNALLEALQVGITLRPYPSADFESFLKSLTYDEFSVDKFLEVLRNESCNN